MAGKGNPRRWRSAKALQAAVDQYFADCEEAHKVPSVGGLALALGYTCRQALDRYTDRSGDEPKDDHVGIITRAKSRIEDINVSLAYNRDASAGARFILQNGFYYSDKHEVTRRYAIRGELSDDDG